MQTISRQCVTITRTPVQHERLKCEFVSNISTYCGTADNVLLDSKLVQAAIAKLKCGKAPCIDGVTAEHVLHCHPTVSLHLLTLFNAMLKHSYVPPEFCTGTTIPLLKDSNLDSYNIDNYRAITISSILSKIFENCLLSRFNRYFETSDLQCGFKAKAGCSEALLLLCSTVQYFTNNGSTVSFDKVNHYALFLKLMERHVPMCLINLLANWYKNVFISVRWGPVSVKTGPPYYWCSSRWGTVPCTVCCIC